MPRRTARRFAPIRRPAAFGPPVPPPPRREAHLAGARELLGKVAHLLPADVDLDAAAGGMVELARLAPDAAAGRLAARLGNPYWVDRLGLEAPVPAAAVLSALADAPEPTPAAPRPAGGSPMAARPFDGHGGPPAPGRVAGAMTGRDLFDQAIVTGSYRPM